MNIKLVIILFGIVASTMSNPCIAPEETEECSARGICIDGECICEHRNHVYEVYTGRYCECDNFSCDRSNNGQLCSGYGTCVCGTCFCDPGRTGLACECAIDPTSPINDCETAGIETNTTTICLDRGKCVCGKCQCDETFFGRHCDKNIFLHTRNRSSESVGDEKLFF